MSPLSQRAGNILLAAGLLWLPMAAMASECWITAAPSIAFGETGPAGASSSGTLGYVCNDWDGAPITYRMCVFANPNHPPGVAPRRMIQWWPESSLDYDLYADPAHTQLIGSESSGHPIHHWLFQVAPGGEQSGSVTIHAHMPAHQTAIAGDHVGQLLYQMHFVYAVDGTIPPPEACLMGPNATGYGTVTTTYTNACQIIAASDMDFGQVANLSGNHDQVAAIQLQCPTNTVWRVGLDDGLHAVAGQRRLSGTAGGHIAYELYRDSTRSLRWGNAIGNDTSDGVGTDGLQSLTVYGRVPAQATPAAGTYSDTITITLTY